MALTSLISSMANLTMLRLTAPVTGLFYGAQWSLMPALASELFGLRHFGLNYTVLGTSVSLSSFLLSNMLVSHPDSLSTRFAEP